MRMGEDRLILAESMVGHLAAAISSDGLLTFAVRWGIEHYGTSAGSGEVLPLQQVDFTDELPAMRATVEEPALRAAADAMLRRMSIDISQLDADFPEVRPPVIVVLTSGTFTEPASEWDAALGDLMTRNPRIEQDRGWQPTVLFVCLLAEDSTPLERLAQAYETADHYAVRNETDAAVVAHDVVAAIRNSVATGTLRLRYARWVMAEKDLVTGTVLERTTDTEVMEVTAHPFPDVTGALAYRRFLDIGDDAEAHPLDVLIDLTAIRRLPPPDGHADRIVDRVCWPLRVVVGDDPRVVTGLLTPAVPVPFSDADEHGRLVPRSIALLRLDGTAPVPVTPGAVPATIDTVARMRLCADLADTLDLAHRYGIVLGTRTLESGVFRVLRRGAEVQLTDCGDARLGDPADGHAAIGDLTWLARFVELCLIDKTGRVDHVQPMPVFDPDGLDLLARAKSNAPSVIPAAAQWRSYLDRRAVQLQGPPIVNAVSVKPAFAPVGATVTVRWRTSHADEISLIAPDGKLTQVPARYADEGSDQLTVTRSGTITVLLRNKVGERRHETAWVNVFELPRLREVPMPIAPPLTSNRTLHQVGDLINGIWALDDDTVHSALTASSVTDPMTDLIRPQRRSLREMLGGRRSEMPQIFPHDMGGWFLQRPEKSRSRKSWWRFPWA
ncbi:hypothetical protein FB565_003175 [Actinoplanes lutulentus]|uniref:hypothetical protein n=1 Tax=Actinoplanes lutulentus TaxID=1287878 RepID=UPI0011B93B11|nr:hypothetical protein [Actinoplanes lutulentus]MBB2943462.1 hypothetical protein [Actinoplanes lutulentus]